MDHKNNCLVCGAPIQYFDTAREMKCFICGQSFETEAACQNGHYICDRCHAADAIDNIYQYCLKTKSQDPIQILKELMRLPSIHMHGPEHHVLVGSALLTAFYNSGGKLPLGLAGSLTEMAKRGQKIPGGVCGHWGACGAALSSGIFISLLLSASPLSQESWRLANQMTAAALTEIAAHGGPRCCKRDAFLAVLTADKFCQQHFGQSFSLNEAIKCEFYPLNAQCRGKDCPFNPAYKKEEV